MEFLDVFGTYSFFAREFLVLLLLALSVYVLMSAGIFALPQVGVMAVGAYSAAILSTNFDVPILVSLLAAALSGGLVSVALVFVTGRLSGIYLAIATIAFSEMVRVTIRNLEITGGNSGLVGIERSNNDFYSVGLLIVVFAVLWRISQSRFGLAIKMMRAQPLVASHQGINLQTYRKALFFGSGLLAGIAGGLNVHLLGFVEPGYFNFELLVDALAATVIGGMTSVGGPLVGGLFIFGIPELLQGFEDYKNIVNGVIIVVFIALAPDGLTSLIKGLWAKLPQKKRNPQGVVEKAAFQVAGLDELSGASKSQRRHYDVAIDGDQGEISLKVQNIGKKFGGIVALKDASLEVHRGEILGIIGPNGSGKTSLLNVMSGVYSPEHGSGFIGEHKLDGSWGKPHELCRYGVARTFQGIRLLDELSVLDNVLSGAYQSNREPLANAIFGLPQHQRSTVATRTTAYALLHELGLDALADTRAGSLPYGLQRKVEIARALISRPSVLLLDEPTAGMAPHERDEVFALVQEVRNRQGVTVIVVEHDVPSMLANCDRLAVMHFGSIVALGDPQEVISMEVVVNAYIGTGA